MTARRCRCGQCEWDGGAMPVWPWLVAHYPEGCSAITDIRPQLLRFRQELVRSARVLTWGAKHVSATLSFLPDEGKQSAERWLQSQQLECKVIDSLVRGGA